MIFSLPGNEASHNLVRAVASGRPVVTGPPPFEICAPPFHVWPPGCCIHPIQYFQNVASPSGFWPLLLIFGLPAAKSWQRARILYLKNVASFWFLAPLLLNPSYWPEFSGAMFAKWYMMNYLLLTLAHFSNN